VGWACNIQKAVDAATGKEITPPEYNCESDPNVLFRGSMTWLLT
jgi:hypothetical protein